MKLNRTEKNLLTFLDPASRTDENIWRFVRPGLLSGSIAHPCGGKNAWGNSIFCFPRNDLFRYVLYFLCTWIGRRRKKVRYVLFLDDGILSCFFDAGRVAGYRAFARKHLPPPKGIRHRLKMLLPPVLRAEQRFIVLAEQTAKETPDHDDIGCLDFMFYSNEDGKLMLTMSETFLDGRGRVLKCAASAGYATNLEHEHATVRSIAGRLARPGGLPGIGDAITLNGKRFFPEDYLCGDSLRERLRLLGRTGDTDGACRLLDRLDLWYAEYRTAFTGPKTSLSSLYARPLRLFLELNESDAALALLVARMRAFLASQDRNHDGVVPVTAHNDLWPGNFIVSCNRLMVVDWERATEQSAPLFDYYLMMISAVLEYRVGSNGSQDYVHAFRQFLSQGDDVCRRTHAKLRDFLVGLGFEGVTLRPFLMLFLMEWSIQGYQALGKQTDMDLLAFSELMAFAEQDSGSAPTQPSSCPAISANMVA